MTRPVIFLDDGGVMNDNQVRGPQWQRLVGEFFTPLLGGTPAAWAEANRVVAHGFFESNAWKARLQATPDYAAFDRAYQCEWMDGMCALVGVPTPPEAACIDLSRRANAYVTRRVRSAFPGAVDAIRTLHARGYTLHTASGEASYDLAGYLEGMEVRECFGRLYGPDLIGIVKDGPEYYARLLADVGVAPADALFVDDSPLVVQWVIQVGARAVLVSSIPQPVPMQLQISSLAALPALLERMA